MKKYCVVLFLVLVICAFKLNAQSSAAEGFRKKGVEYIELGLNEKAIEQFKKAIEINPNDAWAYYQMGFAYEDLENTDEALGSYIKALEIKSNFAPAHCSIGWLFRVKGKYERAEKSLGEAIRLSPDLSSAYLGLALTAADQMKYDEGIKNAGYVLGQKIIYTIDASGLIKADAAKSTAIKGLSHYVLGLCYEGKKMAKESKKEFEEFIKLCPNSEYASIAESKIAESKEKGRRPYSGFLLDTGVITPGKYDAVSSYNIGYIYRIPLSDKCSLGLGSKYGQPLLDCYFQFIGNTNQALNYNIGLGGIFTIDGSGWYLGGGVEYYLAKWFSLYGKLNYYPSFPVEVTRAQGTSWWTYYDTEIIDTTAVGLQFGISFNTDFVLW